MHQELNTLLTAIDFIIKHNVDLAKKTFNLNDYKDKKADYYRRILEKEMERLKKKEFTSYLTRQSIAKVEQAKKLIESSLLAYEKKDLLLLRTHLTLLQALEFENKRLPSFTLPSLPSEIHAEVFAAAKELEQCFEQGLFRSAIILSGRILETCLHRKYYDLTGKDILETSPGIGLGNLIAKLRDINYSFPPGVSEQIHLINQVRIYSVHKKQEVFIPTREQTHAIMLFTLDVVKKLF